MMNCHRCALSFGHPDRGRRAAPFPGRILLGHSLTLIAGPSKVSKRPLSGSNERAFLTIHHSQLPPDKLSASLVEDKKRIETHSEGRKGGREEEGKAARAPSIEWDPEGEIGTEMTASVPSRLTLFS